MDPIANQENIPPNNNNNHNNANRKRSRHINQIEIKSTPSPKRRRFHLDKHVKSQAINGGKEQRQKYMVPKNALEKLIKKQDENKKDVNDNDQHSPPTNYYFNNMIQHIQTDNIDFLAL
eukprot:115028_1